MDATNPEAIRKTVRSYVVVFVALLCLTLVTVGVSYAHLPSRHLAIAIALVIASIKATLVAAFFMHLISERKVIYAVLGLTAIFFFLLLLVPSLTVFSLHGTLVG